MPLKPSKKFTLDLEDTLLPMINIVFLLLIFFLAVGRFYPSEVKRTQLSQLYAPQEYNSKDPVLRMDEEGRIFYKDKRLGFKALRTLRGKPITLSVHKAAKASVLISSMHYLKKKGIKNIRIVVKFEIPL